MVKSFGVIQVRRLLLTVFPPPLFLLLLGLLPAGPVASRPRIGLHGSAPSGGGISSRGRGTSVRGFQAVEQGVKLHKL